MSLDDSFRSGYMRKYKIISAPPTTSGGDFFPLLPIKIRITRKRITAADIANRLIKLRKANEEENLGRLRPRTTLKSSRKKIASPPPTPKPTVIQSTDDDLPRAQKDTGAGGANFVQSQVEPLTGILPEKAPLTQTQAPLSPKPPQPPQLPNQPTTQPKSFFKAALAAPSPEVPISKRNTPTEAQPVPAAKEKNAPKTGGGSGGSSSRTYLEMVTESLQALKQRNGSSLRALQKHMLEAFPIKVRTLSFFSCIGALVKAFYSVS